MHESLYFSSQEILQELIESPEEEGFDAEAIYLMEREIVTKMEQFDLEKKQKAANAVEDLSKLIITAYVNLKVNKKAAPPGKQLFYL
jgi:hypothetical protein